MQFCEMNKRFPIRFLVIRQEKAKQGKGLSTLLSLEEDLEEDVCNKRRSIE